MSGQPSRRVLYVVVCGAGPAARVGTLLESAQADGWESYVIATPDGWGFLDVAAVEAKTGHPVRRAYRQPHEPRSSMPHATAVIVAPATFNTINKLAAGITDNYALGVLAECIGADVPVVVLPFINTLLAARCPLNASVGALRAEGVRVLLGEGGFQPHPPRQGGDHLARFPWNAALEEAHRMVESSDQ